MNRTQTLSLVLLLTSLIQGCATQADCRRGQVISGVGLFVSAAALVAVALVKPSDFEQEDPDDYYSDWHQRDRDARVPVTVVASLINTASFFGLIGSTVRRTNLALQEIRDHVGLEDHMRDLHGISERAPMREDAVIHLRPNRPDANDLVEETILPNSACLTSEYLSMPRHYLLPRAPSCPNSVMVCRTQQICYVPSTPVSTPTMGEPPEDSDDDVPQVPVIPVF